MKLPQEKKTPEYFQYPLLSCLDLNQKVSAKGITKFAQRKLLHAQFKEILFNKKTLRVNNYTIKLKKLEIQTVIKNKIALSSFDGKRFLLFDAVSTLPFGHCKISEDNFFFEIIDISLKETESEITNESSVSSIEKSMLNFVIPDPGFNQPEYSPEELRACTSTDFRGQRAYPKNPFIISEATESRTVEESDSSDMNSSPEIVCKQRKLSNKRD